MEMIHATDLVNEIRQYRPHILQLDISLVQFSIPLFVSMLGLRSIRDLSLRIREPVVDGVVDEVSLRTN